MTMIRISGLKAYTSHGTTYYYLRASGEAVAEPDGTRLDPLKQPDRFAARVQEMKDKLAALPKPKAKAGSLLDLIEAWRGIAGTDGRRKRDPSPEWQQLSAATKKSYERTIDPEKGYLRRALKIDLSKIMLTAIDTPNVVKIRNKVGKAFGFWTGNYAVTVLSVMFGKFGVLYGHMKNNPAKGVPDLARPEDLEDQHRPWADAEFEEMLNGAREREWWGVVLALGLGRFAGWPTGDIINQPPSVWQRPRLIYVRRKTRRRKKVANIQAPNRLIEIIDEVGVDADAKTLVVNESGEPYTEDGLRTMINRLCRELAEAGKVQLGLNIHGLRHSLGNELYDLGLEREARKRMMSHESDAASMIYERGGNRSRQADKATRALNKKHKRGSRR